MNFHNISQKRLFDSTYMVPTPIMSNCYSSKASLNTFSTHITGNSLFRMNKYLSNVDSINKKQGLEEARFLKLPSFAQRSSTNDPVFDPLVQIVGGFVGSKSQAGSTNHRGREFILWDLIVDKILEVMENPEQKQNPTLAKKFVEPVNGHRKVQHNFERITMIKMEHFETVVDSQEVKQPCNTTAKCQKEDVRSSIKCNFWDSYTCDAPVPTESVQINLNCSEFDCRLNDSPSVSTEPPPSESEPLYMEDAIVSFNESFTISGEPTDFEPDDSAMPSSSEIHSFGTFPLKKSAQRSLSECSVDSDDSFIVFESTEDDSVILTDDSDDDTSSLEDLDEIDSIENFPVRSRLAEANKKWDDCYSDIIEQPLPSCSQKKVRGVDVGVELIPNSECEGNKVRFAKDKDLVKVKHLITWDYAHRAARIGPWEMYRRDRQRFKERIATSYSLVISPVLVEAHRKKIYEERFQT